MKIALITNSRIPSLTANSIQVMKVAQALMQLNHEVKMFAPKETELPNSQLLITHYGLNLAPEIEFLPSIKSLKRLDFIFHAQNAAKKFGADLIYTWLPQSALIGIKAGYPVVLEMHADVSGKLGVWWLSQFWKADGKKLMTVTTQALKNALEKSTKLKLSDEAVLIAPNGVELEKYVNLPNPVEARHQLNLKQGLTVGFTGHIYAGRGADLLFELAKQMPQINFLWVGGTPELVTFWKNKLSEANVLNVTMTGFVKHDVIHLYQAAADVLLMPYSSSISASSGQDIAEVINPMKMFEYMASGRAIVCADLPSIREVLNEGNCVFVGVGNWESGIGNRELVIGNWKVEIEKLLADESLRMKLGNQARKDVEQFGWVQREERILKGLNL
jgi:glycosyltransferase involved in cell wall biosynthesis